MLRLKDKVAIITGASSGIGRAAAKLFASEGASLVLGARRRVELDELVAEINGPESPAIAMTGDVQDENYAAALVDCAKSRFGGLDAAFNNAGILGELGPVSEMESTNWHSVIATNLTSAFYAAKYQIPAMKEQGSGSIVFTSSFVGHTNAGMHGMGAYAASEAGLIGLAQSLASQHGPDNIRVNSLLPGGTQTAMAGDDPAIHDYIAGASFAG